MLFQSNIKLVLPGISPYPKIVYDTGLAKIPRKHVSSSHGIYQVSLVTVAILLPKYPPRKQFIIDNTYYIRATKWL